ncbi:hypothetical protein VB773_14480 [Haloarculaceae archaeon H-GB2-1]|nr:hypothetical protein [Haloarculaceae archaeon H-GB11]MEA5408656.1 hypothetical protein [Haloarculaceae archaeon H-GB2-1]
MTFRSTNESPMETTSRTMADRLRKCWKTALSSAIATGPTTSAPTMAPTNSGSPNSTFSENATNAPSAMYSP